ncbi:MAG: DUF2141 domain-containing protein [Porphyrobacter sp.]|nr:DUF2141 domain-containing protein [Porphyrobacter sp.]
MTALNASPRPFRLARRASAGLVLAAALAAPVAAQGYVYGRAMNNDPAQCAQGKGPAVRVTVNGLKSAEGNLFVRAYPANSRDWLESKRYVIRVDARPQAGSVTICVPLPGPGDYAIAVHHDANGNRKSDLADGAGMSNNPGIRKVLGLVPRPPSVDKTRFSIDGGVSRMSINIQYM